MLRTFFPSFQCVKVVLHDLRFCRVETGILFSSSRFKEVVIYFGTTSTFVKLKTNILFSLSHLIKVVHILALKSRWCYFYRNLRPSSSMRFSVLPRMSLNKPFLKGAWYIRNWFGWRPSNCFCVAYTSVLLLNINTCIEVILRTSLKSSLNICLMIIFPSNIVPGFHLITVTEEAAFNLLEWLIIVDR